jgi:hypothetical protein
MAANQFQTKIAASAYLESAGSYQKRSKSQPWAAKPPGFTGG